MKKAVFVTSDMNPVMIKFYREQFNYWQDQVDKVYFCISEYSCPDQKEYVNNLLTHPKIQLVEEHIMKQLPRVMNMASEDVFLLMDDDTIIYDKTCLEPYFKLAEEGCVVAPPHETTNDGELLGFVLRRLYGTDGIYKQKIDPTATFLKYFTFVRRDALLRTDMLIHPYTYQGGVYHKNINCIAPADLTGDMLKIILELYSQGIKWYQIPISNPLNWTLNIIKAGWVHISGLSTSFFYCFRDIDFGTTPQTNKKIYLIRLSFVLEMMEFMDDNDVFKKEVLEYVDRIIKHFGISNGEIKLYRALVKPVFIFRDNFKLIL